MERIEDRESLLRGLWWPIVLVTATYRYVTNHPILGQFRLSSLGCLSGLFPAWLSLTRPPPMSRALAGKPGTAEKPAPGAVSLSSRPGWTCPHGGKRVPSSKRSSNKAPWHVGLECTQPHFHCILLSEQVTHSPNLRAGETHFRSQWADLQIMITFSDVP